MKYTNQIKHIVIKSILINVSLFNTVVYAFSGPNSSYIYELSTARTISTNRIIRPDNRYSNSAYYHLDETLGNAMVYIEPLNPDGSYELTCNGLILDQDHILTAASCLYKGARDRLVDRYVPFKPSNIRIYGYDLVKDDVYELSAEEFYIPVAYNFGRVPSSGASWNWSDADLAIIKTTDKIDRYTVNMVQANLSWVGNSEDVALQKDKLLTWNWFKANLDAGGM